MSGRELRVRFTLDGLCVQSLGTLLAPDRVFVRCPRPPPEGTALSMSVSLAPGSTERTAATVRRAVTSGTERGFEAELEGFGSGRERFDPLAAAGAQPPRVHARVASAREFVILHARGLGNGVLFVPMASPPAVGTMVELVLDLPDQGPPATCDALILRTVVEGPEAGASLKCLGSDTAFHRRVESYFARLAEKPKNG